MMTYTTLRHAFQLLKGARCIIWLTGNKRNQRVDQQDNFQAHLDDLVLSVKFDPEGRSSGTAAMQNG